MKAIVYSQYGSPDVLRLEDVAKPAPSDVQVLVRIHAASINAADWHLLTADIPLVRPMTGGTFKPRYRILGADIAGIVEAVGKNVTQFKPGDEVFGDIGGAGWGGLAEYAAVPETVLVTKPSNLSLEQAAAVPLAAVTALQGLRNVGKIQPGQRVLIQGAAGGVGTYAVQIAKSFDTEVTAVTSTRNLEQARSLGADFVIDYTKQDFTRSGQTYDLIFAANGYHSLSDYKRALTPRGTYVMAGGTFTQMLQVLTLGALVSRGSNKRLTSVSAHANKQDLECVKSLVEAGKVRPAIDRCYPLAQTADAFRYLGTGHARGKVVIIMPS